VPGSNDSERADDVLRDAVSDAASALGSDPRPLAELREEDLRSRLSEAMERRLPARVRRERTLRLDAFQGVGGFDVLVDEAPEGRVAWLAETKWSYLSRSKVFEGAWDAVKLCLAEDQHAVRRGWLVTGAPDEHWRDDECADLFGEGVVSVRDVWERKLTSPGPNGGATVGADLVEGGRGNRFTRAPEQIRVEPVAALPIGRSRESWTIRAVAVSSGTGWIEEFAAPPQFPPRVTERWLRANVPPMSEETFTALLEWLRLKRWTARDLRQRVYPLRRS
jgi:hypothetical protein